MFVTRSALIPRIAAVVILCAALAAGRADATMPTRGGTVPAELRDAFQAGLFELPPRPDPLSTSGAQNVWRVPVVMIGFSDMPLSHSPEALQTALFDRTGAIPTGSAAQYFDWVSEGRLHLSGEVVLAVQLPHPREYYAYNSWGVNTIATPNNIYGMISQALQMAETEGLRVDWSRYDVDGDTYVDMLWVVHAGAGGESLPDDRNNIWSITSRLSSGWRLGSWFETDDLVPGSLTQYIRIDRFSTLPEMSGRVPGMMSEIGVYCHEFGHALGLPDLYDASQLGGAANAGPGNWSLMSTGAYGANGVTPETPSHLGAWPMIYLGWRQAFRPARDTVLTLQPLEQGGEIVELWFQGESYPEHFLIENRQPLGFDVHIPDRGMILYHLDEAVIGARLASNRVNSGLTPGLLLVEADGDGDLTSGRNRGDGLDPFPGGLQKTFIDEATTPNTRTFAGAVTNLGIFDIANVGYDLHLRLQVEAPGWLATEDHTAADYQPLEFGTLPVFRDDGRGFRHSVRSELRGGRSQVILRSAQGDIWTSAVQVSQTSGMALDPTLVALPGGDLAVVWSDTRDGPARIYYRARIGGAWTAEQAITTQPGDARNPALALATDGTLHLAWLQLGAAPRLMFTRFLYTSPFGAAVAVTDSGSPGPPVLAPRPDGGSYIVWTERGRLPNRIEFTRFHPDSGIGLRQPLAPLSFGTMASPRAIVDAEGTMHAVWTESSTGVYRIRYQHRQRLGLPNPTDQIIVQHGNALGNPVLAASPDGALHLAYERTGNGSLELRYLRRREAFGWDLIGTNLSEPEDGDATSPGILAAGAGDVTVFFNGHPQGPPRFNLRRRVLEPVPPPVSVAPSAPPERAGLRAWPSPLRAGMDLSLGLPGAAPGAGVEVYDVGGRLVGSAAIRDGAARIDGTITRTWRAGVYFARPRGGGPSARIVILR